MLFLGLIAAIAAICEADCLNLLGGNIDTINKSTKLNSVASVRKRTIPT
jgi:hypothetical protein